MGLFDRFFPQKKASGGAGGKQVPQVKPRPRVQPRHPQPSTVAGKSASAIDLRISTREVETENELADQISFFASLSQDISGHLQSQICPLQVSKDSRNVIFLVTPAHRSSQEFKEVVNHFLQQGYDLVPPPKPNVFVCKSQQLLIAIAKGQIGGRDLATTKRMRAGTEEGSLWRSFEDVISWAFAEQASDVHFNIYHSEERSQIKFTINGKYVGPPRFRLPTATLSQMMGVAYQKAKGGMEPTFQPLKEQQCNIFMTLPESGERAMLRWASMATDDGPQITMRLLKLDVLLETVSLESLGYLPSEIQKINRAQKSEGGAIIFCGVVGSGKSTTIATVMNGIPSSHKIMTMEDPREYIIKGSHANTIARPLDGSGDDSFIPKMRTLKRSAFDDLLLGEIRDSETGLIFQDVVLTGQNLYTTTHARTAYGVFEKLASPMVNVDRQTLSSPGAVKLAVYQALLPVSCPHCRLEASQWLHEHASDRPYFERVARLYGVTPDMIRLRNPEGCPKCRREGMPELNGFLGRTVVAEMIEPDDGMLDFVRTGDSLGLARYVKGLPKSDYLDPCMDNKSALEAAVYKMSIGMIDPREIEPRFSSWETIEQQRARNRK